MINPKDMQKIKDKNLSEIIKEKSDQPHWKPKAAESENDEEKLVGVSIRLSNRIKKKIEAQVAENRRKGKFPNSMSMYIASLIDKDLEE